MNSFEKMAEQHIREHQVRQQKAQEMESFCTDEQQGLGPDVTLIGSDWKQATINQAGPMGLLDVVAQDLEAFVQLFANAPTCELPPTSRQRRNVHIS